MTVLFLSFITRNWRKFLIPITAIAVLSAFLLFPREQSDKDLLVLSDYNPFPELIEEHDVEDTPIEVPPLNIVIDVKGAVRHPGVYSMEEGDRLIDAISAAGGYLPQADSRLLNHAMKLYDELVVYVPEEGEELTEDEINLVSGPVSPTNDGTVNINTADESQLMTIPGIGPAKAAVIIAYRNEHGLFVVPEDIMNISGIGQKTFTKIEQLIRVK